jgi:hypothetical protein
VQANHKTGLGSTGPALNVCAWVSQGHPLLSVLTSKQNFLRGTVCSAWQEELSLGKGEPLPRSYLGLCFQETVGEFRSSYGVEG